MIQQTEKCIYENAYFDADAAAHVDQFFYDCLRHSKGKFAGQPFRLLPWQVAVIRQVYGWRRPDGSRVYRRGSIWIPKKCGKSTLAAGLILYGLVADDEPGAEIYSAACDRDQAGIIYREAAAMVRASPALAKRLKCIDSIKTIRSRAKDGSFYKALSADVPTKEGINAHCVIVDELHAHKSRALFDTLYYSGAARSQPLQLSISTAGDYDETSVGMQEYLYAKKTISGTMEDPEYFAFIAESPESEPWDSMEAARGANPSFGVTIPESDFQAAIVRAKEDPILHLKYLRYRLNRWTQALETWIPATIWNLNLAPATEDELAGKDCWAGIDMSSTTDLTAICYLFKPESEAGRIPMLFRAYLPEDDLEKKERVDRAPYLAWKAQGWLRTTPGNAIDESFIEEDIYQDSLKFNVMEASYDPKFCRKMAMRLAERGMNMVEIPQTPAHLTESMNDFYGKVIGGRFASGNHPIMKWCVGNCVVYRSNNGLIMPSKNKSTGRIDLLSAAIIANVRAMLAGLQSGEFVWSGF